MNNLDIKSRFVEQKKKGVDDNFRLVENEAPFCSCFTGLWNGRLTLAIKSKEVFPFIESSAAVEIYQENKNTDNYEYFILRDSKFEDPFCSFCADLLMSIQLASSEAEALSMMTSRYELWKRFWRRTPNQLSEEQVRGLAGELLYIKECIKLGMNANDLLVGWHGLQAGDQDFVFGNTWTEVKTVRQGANEILISSLNQLTNPRPDSGAGEATGTLAVYRLHGDPVGENAFTVSDLFDEISKLLSNQPYALQLFKTSIELYGADPYKGHLEKELKLCCLERMRYQIGNNDFPRLIRGEGIPDAVTKVKYSLSIPAIEKWRIKED